MDLETLETIHTRLKLRLEEAHRAVSGESDLRVGHRMGLLNALVLVDEVITAAQGEKPEYRVAE